MDLDLCPPGSSLLAARYGPKTSRTGGERLAGVRASLKQTVLGRRGRAGPGLAEGGEARRHLAFQGRRGGPDHRETGTWTGLDQNAGFEVGFLSKGGQVTEH